VKRKAYLSVDDIETAAGYPIQFPNKLHCRTVVVFTFRGSTELCDAVAAAPRIRRRRRREVVGEQVARVAFDDDQYLMSRTITSEVLDYRT